MYAERLVFMNPVLNKICYITNDNTYKWLDPCDPNPCNAEYGYCESVEVAGRNQKVAECSCPGMSTGDPENGECGKL